MSQHTTIPRETSGHAWTERSRIVLTPVAAPAVLGWFSFAIASLLLGSHLAGWWGGEETLFALAPFFLFIGIGQFLAGMWGFRAREPVATAVHGTWAFLWLGMGLAFTPAVGLLEIAGLPTALGLMLIAVGAVTVGVLIAAVFENILLSVLTGVAAAAAAVTGIGYMGDIAVLIEIGGWLMVAAAAIGWYFATAILVAETTGAARLPIGRYHMAGDVPGEPTAEVVAHSTGMPYLHEVSGGNGRRRRERVAR